MDQERLANLKARGSANRIGMFFLLVFKRLGITDSLNLCIYLSICSFCNTFSNYLVILAKTPSISVGKMYASNLA